MTMKKTAKKKPEAKSTKNVVTAIALQSLLLNDDELLVYKDEEGEYHVMCKEVYVPGKDYNVLYMTYEDI
jgi:hypothetical protein